MKEPKKLPARPVSLALPPQSGHAQSQHNSFEPKLAASTQVKRMLAVSPPPVYRPQPVPKVLQTKMPASHQLVNQSQPAPVVPPIYRPQSVPKVLQTKRTIAGVIAVQPKARRPAAPALYRPQSASIILRATPLADRHQPVLKHSPSNGSIATGCIVERTPGRAFKSAVVQATKFYPNLHPGAAVPVERSNIFTLNSFANQYRLRRNDSHTVNVPNMKYNFVRNREGQTLLHNRYRHPSLAEGQQVLYAGEVFFNNGQLEWWSNGSGHYQPDADGAEQANLPMDFFYSYQQVIKGEHTRRRG